MCVCVCVCSEGTRNPTAVRVMITRIFLTSLLPLTASFSTCIQGTCAHMG